MIVWTLKRRGRPEIVDVVLREVPLRRQISVFRLLSVDFDLSSGFYSRLTSTLVSRISHQRVFFSVSCSPEVAVREVEFELLIR